MTRLALFPALTLFLLGGCGDAETPPAETTTPQAEQPAEPGPLAKALKARADESAKKMPPEVLALFRKAGEELAASELLANATNVGDSAHDFELKDAAGLPVSLSSLRDEGPVVVTFYRGKW